MQWKEENTALMENEIFACICKTKCPPNNLMKTVCREISLSMFSTVQSFQLSWVLWCFVFFFLEHPYLHKTIPTAI